MLNDLLFVPLTKVDLEKREVYGIAAQETADKSKEIMDYETSKPMFQKWSNAFSKATDGASVGNVREMHGKSAAGKLTSLSFNDGEKRIEVCAKIVDDQAWAKVTSGVYTGFSIGGSYAKRWQDGDLKRYTADPSEVSLVDNPCIPTATFTMVKADGLSEQVLFKVKAKPKSGAQMGKLKKGMYGVQALASVLASLQYCANDSKMEALAEGDDSEVPAKLKEAVKTLSGILVQMVQEETAELNPDEEDDMTDTEKMAKAAELLGEVSKALGKAVTGKEDIASIQAIHDHAMKLGANVHEDEEKAVKDKMDSKESAQKKEKDGKAEEDKKEEAEKAAKAEALKKSAEADPMNQILKLLQDQDARLKKVEAQPAAPAGAKPVVLALGKEADTNMRKSAPEVDKENPLDLIKNAHATGGKILTKADISEYGMGR